MRRLYVFVGTFFATFLILSILSFIFTVREIHLIGMDSVNGTQNFARNSLIFLNLEKVETELLSSNPTLSDISVRKQYPHIIIIQAKQNKERAVLPAVDGLFVLSDSGRITQKLNKEAQGDFEKLPQISYYQKFHFQEYNVGDEIGKVDISSAVAFLSLLEKIKLPIESIDITGPHMIVLNNAERRYIISIEKDIELQFQQLKIVHERLVQKGDEYSQIDVRFEKPIVTF